MSKEIIIVLFDLNNQPVCGSFEDGTPYKNKVTNKLETPKIFKPDPSYSAIYKRNALGVPTLSIFHDKESIPVRSHPIYELDSPERKKVGEHGAVQAGPCVLENYTSGGAFYFSAFCNPSNASEGFATSRPVV